MSARVAGSAALISLLCFAHGAAAECTKDIECKGTRICEAGVCVESNEPAEVHAADTDTAEPSDEPPPPYEPSNAGGTHRRSPGLKIAGIVLTVAGGISGLTALSFGLAAATCDENSVAGSLCGTYEDLTLVGAIGFVVLAGAGIPMIIVGGERVPNEATRLQLSPWASSNSGGLRLSGNF